MSPNRQQANGASSTPLLKLRSLLSLHRRMGIISAFFVIVLSVTGLILHHSTTFSLDRSYVSSITLLNWYGIEVPEPGISFSLDGHSATLIGDALYFDNTRLPGSIATLQGIVASEFGFTLASANQLFLVTASGELIETLAAVHGVPANIRQIGSDNAGRIYLRSGSDIIQADIDASSYQLLAIPPPGIIWSQSRTLDEQGIAAIKQAYVSSLLSWERLILDIHSGRLLGGFGALLVDIMAILFVFMAATGVWIWSRRRS